jgi:hypothetical protein
MHHNMHGLSEFDFGLARFCGLLERKYNNDGDGGYSFMSSDGTTLPLTPLMMKEWARCCVSDSAVSHIFLIPIFNAV